VEVVAYKVVMGQCFVRVLQFFPVTVILLLSYSHSFISYANFYKVIKSSYNTRDTPVTHP